MKATSLFKWRALGWSLTAALTAAYIFYFSAAFFAGNRLDTFFRTSVASESYRCQLTTTAEKTGAIECAPISNSQQGNAREQI